MEDDKTSPDPSTTKGKDPDARDPGVDVPVPRHPEDQRKVSGFALEMLLAQLSTEVERAGETGDPGTRHDAAVLLAEARDGLRQLMTR